jgi:NAD(P)-dependent dehydrogenase (short-subunit alcohol dehydrogenase family)
MPTALVTGSNRGIGLELCKVLVNKGYAVIAACRRSSRELDALGVRVEADVEVTNDAAVHAFAARVGDTRLDVLVANSGILLRDTLDDLDLANVRQQFEVNAMGALRVVLALRAHLVRGAKVALITSRLGCITETSGGYYGYRMSKAALHMAGASLAVDLRPAEVAVCLLHTGYVRTAMTVGRGNVEPSTAAAQLVARIETLSLETTGSFWHVNGAPLPW